MKKPTNNLKAKRNALLKQLKKIKAEIKKTDAAMKKAGGKTTKKAAGKTYVIEYQKCTLDRYHARVTIKGARNADDAIRKWREGDGNYPCMGCTGEYPIYAVYLKGHKKTNR